MAWSEDVKRILEVGIPLSAVGINNWALDKDQVMLAIDEFERNRIPILGGDVYEMADGYLEANYDSWHCDRDADEELGDFVKRSVKKARNYISCYGNADDQKIYFVLVAQ